MQCFVRLSFIVTIFSKQVFFPEEAFCTNYTSQIKNNYPLLTFLLLTDKQEQKSHVPAVIYSISLRRSTKLVYEYSRFLALFLQKYEVYYVKSTHILISTFNSLISFWDDLLSCKIKIYFNFFILNMNLLYSKKMSFISFLSEKGRVLSEWY